MLLYLSDIYVIYQVILFLIWENIVTDAATWCDIVLSGFLNIRFVIWCKRCSQAHGEYWIYEW